MHILVSNRLDFLILGFVVYPHGRPDVFKIFKSPIVISCKKKHRLTRIFSREYQK